MFGIGGFELFLILLFGFLVFGPDKLPEIAKTVGRAIAKFRDAQAEVTSTLQNVAFDKNSDQPFKNPFDSAEKVKATVEKVTNDEATEPVRESFSERKARYERERKEKGGA